MRSLFLLCLPWLLWAGEVTLAFLQQKPASIEKDYYIWRFLDQNISSQEAKEAFYQIYNVTWDLFGKYASKSQDPVFEYVATCYTLKPEEYLDKDPSCIKIGLSVAKATKLGPAKLLVLAGKIKSEFPSHARILEILASQDPFEELLQSEPELFLTIMNECTDEYRQTVLERENPLQKLQELAKTKGFERTIKIIVTNPALNNLQKSLLPLSSKDLSFDGAFYLGMNAVKHGQNDLALEHLKNASKKAYFQMDKDRVLFWSYMLSRDAAYLQELIGSFDINIYSLYAHELVSSYPSNIVSHFDLQQENSTDFNLSDPFAFLELRNAIADKNETELVSYAKQFKSRTHLPIYAYIMQRAYRYKHHPFIMPYTEQLADLSTDDKALYLALARQESLFIPSSISRSYALGVMQIMPFLVRSLAKELGEQPDLDTMMDPAVNIRYAKRHIGYLQRYLMHPLFIAYAYNGGIGFTKRMLLNGYFGKGPFEPFLSLELIPYAESNLYGKKVLANYVIYKSLLEEPVSLINLLQTLTEPSQTDRFRMSTKAPSLEPGI